MLDAPNIIKTSSQPVAMIPLTVPRHEIQQVMGPGIQEIYAALAQQGIAPTGAWRTHHRRPPSDVFDFEICVPIDGGLQPTGRVQAGQIAAATVARTIYHGPYEGLGDAWGELREWVRTQGHTAATNLWEVYLAGPESGDDPTQWRTELNQPLRV